MDKVKEKNIYKSICTMFDNLELGENQTTDQSILAISLMASGLQMAMDNAMDTQKDDKEKEMIIYYFLVAAFCAFGFDKTDFNDLTVAVGNTMKEIALKLQA